MNFNYGLISTSSGKTDVTLDFEKIRQTVDAFRKLPSPLSIIYATPAGVARLPKAPSPDTVPGNTMCWTPNAFQFRPLGSIAVEVLPTESECQTAMEAAIERGERAAMLTDVYYFDPIENAREFAKDNP